MQRQKNIRTRIIQLRIINSFLREINILSLSLIHLMGQYLCHIIEDCTGRSLSHGIPIPPFPTTFSIFIR